MRAPTLSLLLAATLAPALLPPAPATAREYNIRPFLAPEHQVKIQTVIARGRRMQAGGDDSGSINLNPSKDVVSTGCGALRVGNIDTGAARPGQRLPRENIIVARDIINTTLGCGR